MGRTAAILALSLALWAADPGPPAPVLRPYFSPRGGCTAAVVAAIDSARSWVRVQAYSFTSAPISAALVRARVRGVDVAVILDPSQPVARGSRWPDLLAAGVPVSVDSAHAIAHNKVVICDGETVVTGSFNFTGAAESANAENVLVVGDRATAAAYADNWRLHAGHSRPLVGAGR